MATTTAHVAVNFLEGDTLTFELTETDTVNNLQAKIAAARGKHPHAVTLLLGDEVLLDTGQPVLAAGKEFTATLRETLGVDFKTMPPLMEQAPWAPGYGYAVVVQEERLLVIGGVQNEYEGQDVSEFCDNAIWAVTPGACWELLPRPPWQPRRFHSAAADATGRLLVFGGENDKGRVFRDSWSFDGCAWQELAEVPWLDNCPDAAVGTAAGALVIADGTVYEFSEGWKMRCLVPAGSDVTNCTLVGDILYVGTHEGCILILREQEWSAVQMPMLGYSMVCTGAASQVFIYMSKLADGDSHEEKGLGSILALADSKELRQLGVGVIPRVIGEHQCAETMGLQYLFQAWNGIGILSCCGHLLLSV